MNMFWLTMLLLQPMSEVEWVRHIQQTEMPQYRTEVVLWDNSRVDMLDEYAIEVDWVEKWAEAIGQVLFYSKITNKPPMIILLVKHDGFEKFVARCLIATDIPVRVYDTRTKKWIQ